MLSVALVLLSRVTDVIRYAALWCPDFPTQNEFGSTSHASLSCKSTKYCLTLIWNVNLLLGKAHPGWNGMFELILKMALDTAVAFQDSE
ncbi:hypothetical protein AXA65_11525 [Chryseobacterium sp. FP211-J200]|uniref:hypothetical protein n=1 Tax=Chryseobacterium sp. FP211-J200 TaxID=1792309 RepID=UPI0007C7EE4E|nr:hypothetical protein [Chryseobacterium sp. FP211-J200]OAH71744.1 hypothetical protein AXA65_11525 [Chryseobacterium sp. FP211-J200]